MSDNPDTDLRFKSLHEHSTSRVSTRFASRYTVPPKAVRGPGRVPAPRRPGWLARAEKKDDEAFTLLLSAADLEDSTDKHPATPGSVPPAREQLAALLAEPGQPPAHRRRRAHFSAPEVAATPPRLPPRAEEARRAPRRARRQCLQRRTNPGRPRVSEIEPVTKAPSVSETAEGLADLQRKRSPERTAATRAG